MHKFLEGWKKKDKKPSHRTLMQELQQDIEFRAPMEISDRDSACLILDGVHPENLEADNFEVILATFPPLIKESMYKSGKGTKYST